VVGGGVDFDKVAAENLRAQPVTCVCVCVCVCVYVYIYKTLRAHPLMCVCTRLCALNRFGWFVVSVAFSMGRRYECAADREPAPVNMPVVIAMPADARRPKMPNFPVTACIMCVCVCACACCVYIVYLHICIFVYRYMYICV
jgi:hypothetical protein